ncbi:MAG: hypothetical protein KIT36_16570 [Alphaproteobacteria bacterium]|nr:hypothetical protein [Alphaproteobacteria bacterium]
MLLTALGVAMLAAGGVLLYSIRHRGDNRQPRLLQSDPLVYSLGFVVVCLATGGMILLIKGALFS